MMNSSHRPAVTAMITGTIIAVTGAVLGAAGPPAAASPASQAHQTQPDALPHYVMWDLGSDFGITATNPQPDSYGNRGVWSWMQGSDLRRPSTFTRLRTFSAKIDNIAGLDGWQGPIAQPPPLPGVPLIAVNASRAIADGSTNPAMGATFWPENVMLMHPAPASDAIVRWTSPVPMTVTVTVTLAKLDRVCGTGITWRLADGGTELAGGAISAGGNPQGTVRTLPVTAGTRLYLEVGPGPGNDYGCDSTAVSLTITGHN